MSYKPIYAIWIEDVPKYITTLLYNLKPDFDDLKLVFNDPDVHIDTTHIDTIARAIDVDIVLVDYNLPGEINGDDVIKIIRSHEHNNSTPIIFYSSNLDSEELQRLVEGLINVFCCHRDDLGDEIIRCLKR